MKTKKSELDTDELSSEEEEIKKPKKKSSPKETINPKKAPLNNATNTNAAVQPLKKRRLFKVMSNRYLETNNKVTVFGRDPFFEESPSDSLFVSPLIESKIAFRSIHLNDLSLLKSLLNDSDRIPTVHLEKSVYNKWTPAEYALYLNNIEALEILIDDFLKKKDSRIEMPETMFHKFSSGSYNQRSLGPHFTRKLTESRGAKEGNNALVKDNDNSDHIAPSTFFKRLFEVAFQYGVSNEVFDLLLTKSEGNFNKNSMFDNIVEAVCFGHRKLAAHVMEKAPGFLGFNAVHLQVLKTENDADLTCQLRSNMCTKKPYMNEQVTPIHCACINPNVKYLKTLLSITQEFNIGDKKGRKPVHYAAVCEGPSPLEYLVSRVSPYEMDAQGSTPLHYACEAGRSANVEMLLTHAKTKNDDDSTQTTEILMDNKYGVGGINKPNRRGKLPLHLAIARNNFDCVKVLIKYDCNVEYPLPNSMGKITPLMYAAQLGHHKIVQLLVENNAKVEARDRFHRTAALHAAMCGHARTLSFLLRLGANPNACDSSGNSCLHYACAYGWYFCMKVLLDAGAHFNVSNDWKLTPFGAAFLKGHVGICEQLLNTYPNQIDINFRTEEGENLVILGKN